MSDTLCGYEMACAENVNQPHWTCLVRLHKDLKELEDEKAVIQHRICEKEKQISRFYQGGK